VKMSLRQRLEALYFRGRTILLRRCNTEAHLIVTQVDMSGRKTLVPAIASLDLPIDWRSMQRARQESFVVWGVALVAWTLIVQSALVAASNLADTWWLPGSFIPSLLAQPDWWQHVPWPSLIVWGAGLLVVDAITRTVCVYRACDRSGLSVEHGSARFAVPEDLASNVPGDNLFPPGYDIYGGFNPVEIRRRIVDFERLTAHKRVVEERMFQSEAPELPMGSPALVQSSPAPQKRSRIQELLDG